MKLLKILTILCCFAICGCTDKDEPAGGPDPTEMSTEVEDEIGEMGEDPGEEAADEPPAVDEMGDKSNEHEIPKDNEGPS